MKLEEAQEVVLKNADLQGTVETELLQSLGLTLGEDIRADRDQPPFDRALVDGVAVRAEDGRARRTLLPQTVAAGHWPEFTLERGQAVRIMTGAPVPRGADTVVKREDVLIADGTVELVAEIERGRNIALRAGELRQGGLAAPKGTRITPAVLALLASFGRQTVRVYEPVRVAVVTTGDEIVEYNIAPGPSQIRNSNAFTLLGLLEFNGADAGYVGIARDSVEEIVPALRGALDRDLVIMTGGSAEGDFDLAGKAIETIGARVYFRSVAIRPGRPVRFAKIGRKALFSLPGNPASVVVDYHLLVRPYLDACLGVPEPLPPYHVGSLATPILKKGARRRFLHGRARSTAEGVEVEPFAMVGASDLVNLARANCLLALPEGEVSLQAGATVRYLRLDDPSH
ncbi:MAG: gephyrin-like molybdotransferase Glp [Acidobacteriota bacterium]